MSKTFSTYEFSSYECAYVMMSSSRVLLYLLYLLIDKKRSVSITENGAFSRVAPRTLETDGWNHVRSFYDPISPYAALLNKHHLHFMIETKNKKQTFPLPQEALTGQLCGVKR